VFVPRRPSFTEEQVRAAVPNARCYSDVLRAIGLRVAGGNFATIKKYIDEIWRIPTDHFDPRAASSVGLRRRQPVALREVLVLDSSYNRGDLKRRLYAEGLKARVCELCAQTEEWNGRRMSLILDHVNGDARDNRLENLRIVCPNCNATLETHCGRNKPRGRPPIECRHCGGLFRMTYAGQRFCSQRCAGLHQPRRVERPPYEQLLAEITETSYVAVGRKYGVSDNAIRKWVRAYERERELGRVADVEAGAERGDDGVRGVALGDDRADAVDALDHACGLVGRQGADDGEEGVGSGGADGLDAGAVERRQPEVEDDGVGLAVGGHRDRLVPVLGGADDVEAGVGEDRAGQQAEAGCVIADQDPGRRGHVTSQDATWQRARAP